MLLSQQQLRGQSREAELQQSQQTNVHLNCAPKSRRRRRTVAGVRLFTTSLRGIADTTVADGGMTRNTPCRSAGFIGHAHRRYEHNGVSPQATASSPVLHCTSSYEWPQGQRQSQLRRGCDNTCKTRAWTTNQLKDAIAVVDRGMKMKKASDLFYILYLSVCEWCYGLRTTRKRGPPTILSPSEENQIVDNCIRNCEMGQGLTPTGLKMKVYYITKSMPIPFRNGIPGGGWMH